jgi:predicted DNA-binding transcriptional regulator AlpA
MSRKYMRAKELIKYLSISRATLYSWAKKEDFPKPIKASHKVTLWDVEAIEKYLQSKAIQ